MDKLPELDRLSASEKDALIRALWTEVQGLNARLAALESKPHEPRKDAHNSSVPPAQTPQPNLPTSPPRGTRREASVGRAGGGRSRPPDPDQVIIAQAKTCPHCGGAVQAPEPHVHAVYDKSELPPIRPIVTRVEQYAGPCPHGGQTDVAPVPVGLEPGTPVGASIEALATYLRYPHTISDERLSALLAQVYGVPISEGALAHLFPRVKARLDDRIEEILTRLRRRRLICSDETGARVNGCTQWAWVLQHTAVCVQVIRPSRGQGVLHEVLGTQRPTRWVSALYSAQPHHPAADWQVCLAHPLRYCQFACGAGDTVVGTSMTSEL